MTVTQLLVMYLYPALVGIALGFFYYGVLWLILRKLPQLNSPAIWIGPSLLVRLFTVMAVMYLLFSDSWQQLLAALFGMLIARTYLIRHIKPHTPPVKSHLEQTP